MPAKRFLIAPLAEGEQTNVEPWLIPDNAYARLENMYLFRSRIRKRFGSRYTYPSTAPTLGTEQLFSRLRIPVDTLSSEAASGTVPGSSGSIGQLFSIGDYMFTVTQSSGNMLINGTAATATFNTATGAYVFTGVDLANGTAVYWYPSLPVMGIGSFEQGTVNFEPTYIFDTRYAYTWNDGWQRSATGSATWSGDDADFFWTTTWRGANPYDNVFFVTNFRFTNNGAIAAADPIRYITQTGNSWTNFTPQINAAGTTLYTCRILLPFKDRLLALNTVENISGAGTVQQFGTRCRFSQNGTPLVDVTATTWREDLGGRGGYIDAPTKEQIVTAQFLKDRLIVFFERSTWELVYTGNEILPFRWQKINTELGAESTFSQVPFDDQVIGVGNVGIHGCNGSSVQRIDKKIPDTVFDIQNKNEGLTRVHGIRDYWVEQVYWTFPDTDQPSTYPRKVLVYNYESGNWAFNDDSITALGYFQIVSGLTWADMKEQWREVQMSWSSGSSAENFRYVIGGNQEGYVFMLDTELSANIGALQITNVTDSGGTQQAPNNYLTIVDPNLRVGDFLKLENMNGLTITDSVDPDNPVQVGGVNVQVVEVTGDTVVIAYPNDAKSVITVTGAYTGGGTAARVSRPRILTKQYNFFNEVGNNMALDQIDFLVDRTEVGEFSVQAFPSSIPAPFMTDDAYPDQTIIETRPYDGNLYPLESLQKRLWHSMYSDVNGETCQLQIFLSDQQMFDIDIAESNLTLHAMMFYVQSTSARFE